MASAAVPLAVLCICAMLATSVPPADGRKVCSASFRVPCAGPGSTAVDNILLFFAALLALMTCAFVAKLLAQAAKLRVANLLETYQETLVFATLRPAQRRHRKLRGHAGHNLTWRCACLAASYAIKTIPVVLCWFARMASAVTCGCLVIIAALQFALATVPEPILLGLAAVVVIAVVVLCGIVTNTPPTRCQQGRRPVPRAKPVASTTRRSSTTGGTLPPTMPLKPSSFPSVQLVVAGSLVAGQAVMTAATWAKAALTTIVNNLARLVASACTPAPKVADQAAPASGAAPELKPINTKCLPSSRPTPATGDGSEAVLSTPPGPETPCLGSLDVSRRASTVSCAHAACSSSSASDTDSADDDDTPALRRERSAEAAQIQQLQAQLAAAEARTEQLQGQRAADADLILRLSNQARQSAEECEQLWGGLTALQQHSKAQQACIGQLEADKQQQQEASQQLESTNSGLWATMQQLHLTNNQLQASLQQQQSSSQVEFQLAQVQGWNEGFAAGQAQGSAVAYQQGYAQASSDASAALSAAIAAAYQQGMEQGVVALMDTLSIPIHHLNAFLTALAHAAHQAGFTVAEVMHSPGGAVCRAVGLSGAPSQYLLEQLRAEGKLRCVERDAFTLDQAMLEMAQAFAEQWLQQHQQQPAAAAAAAGCARVPAITV